MWAVLRAASPVATLAPDASSAADPRQPEEPVGAACAAYLADVEAKPAGSGQQGGTVDLHFTRAGAGAEDCHTVVEDHLAGRR